jgi:hypothetical protein
MVKRSEYPVKKVFLADEERGAGAFTPDERVAMVWQLTLQAWLFKEGRWDEPRLRRDVVRIHRNRA